MRRLYLLLFLFSFQFVAAQKAKPYKVIAYYTGNGELVKQYPVYKLTHIIYSFVKLQNDTLLVWDSVQENTLRQIVSLKNKYPLLKVMVSFGGWGGCAPCSSLFADPVRRKNFAESVVIFLKKYGVDGLDIDWEYPAIEGFPGHKYITSDRENFTELVKALRKEMRDEYLLSFAAGGFVKYLEQSVDWDLVMPLVDFVNLMTYDLVGGYATTTGHHTPLFSYRDKQESAGTCINWLLYKKIPASKLIMGAAFYARVWENVQNKNHGLYQPGIFKQGVGYAQFSNYFTDTSGFHYYWDKKSMAPYQYNASKHLFATFDDKRSIREKIKFVRRKKLGGIMFWELLNDLTTNGLLDEISKDL